MHSATVLVASLAHTSGGETCGTIRCIHRQSQVPEWLQRTALIEAPVHSKFLHPLDDENCAESSEIAERAIEDGPESRKYFGRRSLNRLAQGVEPVRSELITQEHGAPKGYNRVKTPPLGTGAQM